MLDYDLSTVEESVLEARQNRWLKLNFGNIDHYIRNTLVFRFKIQNEDDQEELTARAYCHTVEKVRMKAYIDKEDGGWGSSSHDIIKQLKKRLQYFLLDEVIALQKGSSGRGQSDFYDAAKRSENVIELGDGEEVSTTENVSVGMYGFQPDGEQLLIWKQAQEIIQSVADETQYGDVLLSILMGEITQIHACEMTGMATSTMNDKVKRFRQDLRTVLEGKGYVKGETF